MKTTLLAFMPFLSFMPNLPTNAHGIGWTPFRHQCNYSEQKPTIANKSLAANKVFGYSVAVAANSAIECGSSYMSRRTAPRKRFFCARFMVGCAWEAFAPAGILDAGLPHPRTVRHPSCGSDPANSISSRSSTMKTLTLPIAAKIKRGRIAAHKKMAYAALHADSSLNVRLARYNSHMSKARAIAGGAL